MIFSRESLYGWGVCDIPMPRLARGRGKGRQERRLFRDFLTILRRDFDPVTGVVMLLLLLLFFGGVYVLSSHLPVVDKEEPRQTVDVMVRLLEEPPLVSPPPPPPVESVEIVEEVPPPLASLPVPEELPPPPPQRVVQPEPHKVELPSSPEIDLPLPSEASKPLQRSKRETLSEPERLPAFSDRSASPADLGVPSRPVESLPRKKAKTSLSMEQNVFTPEKTPSDIALAPVALPSKADRVASATLHPIPGRDKGIDLGERNQVSLDRATSLSARDSSPRSRNEMQLASSAPSYELSHSSRQVDLNPSKAERTYEKEKNRPGASPSMPVDAAPVFSSSSKGETLPLLSGAAPSVKTAGKPLPDTFLTLPEGKPFDPSSLGALDPALLVKFSDLQTCLDPGAEMSLKSRLASLVVSDSAFKDEGLVFYIQNPRTAYDIRVDVYNYGSLKLGDRCAVLMRAISCVEKKR